MKIKSEIKEEIRKFIREKLQKKQQEVKIIAPYRLTEIDLKELNEKFPNLKDKNVTIVVDPSLIAGLILKQGTKVLDLSLVGRIRSLQQLVNEVS